MPTHQRGRAYQFFIWFRVTSAATEIWYQHNSVVGFSLFLWVSVLATKNGSNDSLSLTFYLTVAKPASNYSKLMYGHTYKLVSKYLKLTVYLIGLCSFFLSVSYPTRTKNKIVTKSSCHTSKPFSATVKGKLFNFCSSDSLKQLMTLL